MKRLFDIVFSSLGLVILSPLFLVVAVLIRLDSPGPVFYRQERVGKGFKTFRIIKFRTMVTGADKGGALITLSGDSRITRTGRVLRKYKIDEIPQLINVLIGDMSFVGPRPEVDKYVQLFISDYRTLLSIRPGITDPSSLRYASEENLLCPSGNWEETYTTKILPEKIKLSIDYVENRSFMKDLKLIATTIVRCFHRQRSGENGWNDVNEKSTARSNR